MKAKKANFKYSKLADKDERDDPSSMSDSQKELLEELAEEESGMLRMTGYDHCIIGIAHRYGMAPVLAYDKEQVIEQSMRDGCTYEEAIEHFEYNQIGGWHGDGTWMFIEKV